MASKGHGKPNTSMVGNVGDLYEDLDTGMVYRLASIVLKEKQMGFVTIPEYVCETNQYIWAPVADAGLLSIVFDVDYDEGTYVCNQTLDTILDCVDNGRPYVAYMNFGEDGTFGLTLGRRISEQLATELEDDIVLFCHPTKGYVAFGYDRQLYYGEYNG